jgi:hypothetical protein
MEPPRVVRVDVPVHIGEVLEMVWGGVGVGGGSGRNMMLGWCWGGVDGEVEVEVEVEVGCCDGAMFKCEGME